MHTLLCDLVALNALQLQRLRARNNLHSRSDATLSREDLTELVQLLEELWRRGAELDGTQRGQS